MLYLCNEKSHPALPYLIACPFKGSKYTTAAQLYKRLYQYIIRHRQIKLKARLKALYIPHNGRIDEIIIKTVGNSDILTFGRKLLLSWSAGNKDTDNALLVLIAMDDGKAAVITGITIQKTVTNAICRNIIKHNITPHFKNGEYYEGLDETATDLVKAVKKEYKLAQVK